MINEEVSRSSLNLEVRLAKATSKAILDALKKVDKQIEKFLLKLAMRIILWCGQHGA